MVKFIFRSLVIVLVTLSFSAQSEEKTSSIGIGYGLPFGGYLGLGYEQKLTPKTAFVLGVGTLINNVGYNAGLRYYFSKPDSKLKARVTALYGVNALFTSYYHDDEVGKGISIGPGLLWHFSENWAFGADLFLVETKSKEGYEIDDPRLSFSFGFSRAF